LTESGVRAVAAFGERLLANVERVMIGKRATIESSLVALLCEGHILLEDVPGVGKTTLARALARSVGGEFRRVQCTPDLLPSDISGITFYNQRRGEFEFRPGPIFANIVLADEINRATPRTQSALLEAMAERTVTIEGETMPLPRPFLVLATENPIELEGTFPLPEAQLDRFLLRLSIGYPDEADEEAILARFGAGDPLAALEAVATPAELIAASDAVRTVTISADLRRRPGREPARHPGARSRVAGARRVARAGLRSSRRHQGADPGDPGPPRHPQPGSAPARAHGDRPPRRDHGEHRGPGRGVSRWSPVAGRAGWVT